MFSPSFDKEKKLWYGPDIPALYNPHISIAQALLHSMSMFGSKIAEISDIDGRQVTFDEIQIESIRAAQNLQILGYKPKDVFTVMAKNSRHVAPIVFASLAIGCPINTLDSSFGKTEVIHMMTITKPVLVFCDVKCYQTVDECLKKLNNDAIIFTFGGIFGRSQSVETLFEETQNENQFIPVKVDGPNETAMIVCSSGTTGLPKGVCLSHTALLDSLSRFGLSSNYVMLSFSSLFWASGVIALLGGTLVGATRIITTDTFSPELQIRLIEKYKVTYTMNAPHQILLMLKCDRFNSADFSSVKYMLVGGSQLPSHIKTDMQARLPNGFVYSAYGLSEVIGPVVFDYPAVKANDKDNVTRIIGGACIKIIDDDGNRCGVNVDGEICIKMTYRFLGYHNNPEATAALFDKDGFIVTGDVGHFDDDGNLFVTGRKKELLKYYNFPIVPSEIDAFLTESPDIESACVCGIPDPLTDLIAAVVVRAHSSNISEKVVFDMVADHFADHYKLRGGVYFVNELPTTPSGKILRRKAQEIAIKLHSAGDSKDLK